ncbi:MAG: CHASE3 domain-containing protein [Pacificimonas sp.]
MAVGKQGGGVDRLWGWGLALSALIVALIGMALLSATAFRQTIGTESARSTAEELYAESYQTIQAAEALYNALQDAERGQRGYVVTENPLFLEPYNENVSETVPRFEELAALVTASTVQSERVAALERIIDLKLEEMAGTIEQVRRGDRAAAEREIATGYGRRLMVEVETIIDEIRIEEQRQLSERRTALENSEAEQAASIAQLALFGTALLITALLAALAVGVLLWRSYRSSERERLVEEENEALEEAVASRTRELVQTNQRLLAEARQRETAEDRLRQAQRMEAIGQLTGGIAHDFNNMLAVVIGSLDLLKRRTKEDPKMVRLIDNALEGANRAATLTSRLLAFSRQQSLKPEVTDLNSLVGGMQEFLRRTLNETIHIDIDIEENAPDVFVDGAELENVIINLAANARDAMPGGGTLSLATGLRVLDEAEMHQHQRLEAGRYAVVTVADTGLGMEPEVLAKVYEPFFTTKPVGRGTGLGLSQVHGFVLQSGGSIDINSAPGKGTRIELILPEGHAPKGIVKPETAGLGDIPMAKDGETILVVEDQAQLRQLTVDMLTDLGYDVRQASSAGEALIALDEEPRADLLFTDIVMPDQSGEELARTARGLVPNIRLLYTSGYTKAAGVDAATLQPPAELLRKPATVEDLANAVRRALDAD